MVQRYNRKEARRLGFASHFYGQPRLVLRWQQLWVASLRFQVTLVLHSLSADLSRAQASS